MLSSTDSPFITKLKAEKEKRRRLLSPLAPAWESYLDPDPVRWIQTHFFIPETNGPIILYPFHQAGLREALAVEDDGLFRYSTVVWSAIKKSAKSSIAAAVALWMAWQKPWSSIKIIANDLKQADSRVFFYIRRSLELNAEMRKHVQIRNYHITLPNHSTIEALPIDPTGEAGGNDDLVIYSELWGWKSTAAQKMWTETTLSPLKYGKSLRWAETYAGASSESPTLENLWQRGVKEGQCIDAENEFYRNQRLLVIWNTKPSTPWQTPEYYQQEAADLLENEFNRVHKNQWGSSESSYIPAEWWDACRSVIPAYEKLEPWVVALDAAVSGDCFGLVAVTRKNGIVIVRHVRKWVPPPGGQIMYNASAGTPPNQDESPAGELRRICNRHSVVKVIYDPFQLHSFCSQMKEELIVFFEAFSQTTKRLQSDKALRDMIRERKIWHDGNLDLREHLTNANAKSEGDDRIRIIKRKESLKIDLAVCLSMSAYEAERMGL
jgi:phage terminase large subunit-like protein